jgi:hypothetical protein
MKTTYHVLESGKPATYEICSRSLPNMSEEFEKTWTSNVFESLADAQKYARAWCGIYYPKNEDLKVGEKIDFSGYGDTIEIKEFCE